MILLNLDAASSLAPCGVCTWSLSERACQFVIIIWLVERETSYTSLRMCRNILKCVSDRYAFFYVLDNLQLKIFCDYQKDHFPPSTECFEKYHFLLIKKSRWTCDFEKS